MIKDHLNSLLSLRDKTLKANRRETQDSVEMLKEIVQYCVESNDDKAAYEYQKQICAVCSELYGPDNIITKRAKLYCRELMIRTAAVPERVRLYREYWRDAKEEYGENSYLVKILAPMYITYCIEANEIEELRIVCSEVVSYFKDSDDDESRQLAAVCSDLELFTGEKSGSVEELNKASKRAEILFGKGSLVSLWLQNETGFIYKKNKEYEKAAELFRKLYCISAEKHGKYHRDTLYFQKNHVLNTAFCGQYKQALKEAKTLEKAVKKCPDKNVCPDVYECFMYIYMKQGKDKLAGYYGKLSVEFNQKVTGDDLTAEKTKFVLAARRFAENLIDRAAFSEMLDYMTLKERWLYNLFSLSSNITRERVFDSQNRGEYDICLGLALNGRENLQKEDVLALWEVVCNYKSLVGDCELLHEAISRDPDYLNKEKELNRIISSGNISDIAEAQRQILDMTKRRNYPEYVNSVHVSEIQRSLKKGETLLDYYCVHFSDLQEYTCIAVTPDKVELLSAGSIVEVELLVEKLTAAVCDNKRFVLRPKTSENADTSQGAFSALVEKTAKLLHVDAVSALQRVYVCPDGELYRLPFDVLFKDNTETVYVTNAKDIVRKDGGSAPGQPLIKDICVFADPLFYQNREQTGSLSDNQTHQRAGALSRLPGTYVEANIIRRIFGDGVKQFIAENATRRALFENCSTDILHIGSHAAGDGGGMIYLSGTDGCGVAEDGESRGPDCVTSQDIAGLNMDRVRLAVLSACQTGIGEYRNYLGVRGLRRSFQLAGAENVISTMWNINDLATAIFMYAFYSKYKECFDCVTSLHFAKSYLKTSTVNKIKNEVYREISDLLLKSGNIKEYREFRDIIQFGDEKDVPFSSPYYWAGFSLYR